MWPVLIRRLNTGWTFLWESSRSSVSQKIIFAEAVIQDFIPDTFRKNLGANCISMPHLCFPAVPSLLKCSWTWFLGQSALSFIQPQKISSSCSWHMAMKCQYCVLSNKHQDSISRVYWRQSTEVGEILSELY